MSNRPSAPHTDRPTATATATYPTGYPMPGGWQVDPRPSCYLDPADPADAPRLARADATPTGVFPTRPRPRPRLQHEGGRAGDAASLSRGGARPRASAHAVYHTSQQTPAGKAPSEQPRHRARRHLRAALTGIALAAALLTGLQLYALDGINDAREAARAAGSATPSAMSGQTPDARSGTQPDWVTHDSGAPYSKDDPAASPLDLPRCTTAPTTPRPCLAHVSADSRHAVVLEEDASLTGLDRQ